MAEWSLGVSPLVIPSGNLVNLNGGPRLLSKTPLPGPAEQLEPFTAATDLPYLVLYPIRCMANQNGFSDGRAIPCSTIPIKSAPQPVTAAAWGLRPPPLRGGVEARM